jgi:hypothetical protein
MVDLTHKSVLTFLFDMDSNFVGEMASKFVSVFLVLSKLPTGCDEERFRYPNKSLLPPGKFSSHDSLEAVRVFLGQHAAANFLPTETYHKPWYEYR